MIRVLFFGPVADCIGARQIELPYRDGLRWQDVRNELQPRHPEAFALVSIVAVNGERVRDEEGAPLADGAEVVFMSSFSGG
ncbi:MoaD/ThiS family protein [Propionivibrio limicola]|uniref:MoaD/ThiS family protein n=1 Tax=Propionivibrio limicola TaxID=167645 RepID=UPI001290EA02|nr:MoaD/ThiS family protein [Propionivibrio limicola]